MNKQKQAEKIYENIQERLNELIGRAEERSLNPSYMLAFQVGLTEDIKGGLS